MAKISVNFNPPEKTRAMETVANLMRQFELEDMQREQYIQSAEWKSLRTQALIRAKYRCQICDTGIDDTQLKVYNRAEHANQGMELLEDMFVVCELCSNALFRSGRIRRRR